MKDQEIIQMYCNRQEMAIQKTAEKYEKYCYTISYNILDNNEDVLECINDTWFKLWDTIPPIIPIFLKSYIAKIVRNLSFDKYRAKNSAKNGGGEMPLVLDELSEIVADSRDIQARYESKEVSMAISEYLSKISVKEREIFVRRYFYVEDTESIARKYNTTGKNVLMILSRTRKKLRTYLQEKELI